MGFIIKFEDDYGHVSEVGMNNLMIIRDGRIKTNQGILNRVNRIITMYHPFKTNKVYRVYRMSEIRDTWAFMFKGKNKTLLTFKENG